MKKQMKGFVLGVTTTLLISSITVAALAATNMIEIQPISIMVNGKVFQPKDANGKDAMVFSYNGTTYAPLRALAETFGQTVGYDSEKNMATVGEVPIVKEPSTSEIKKTDNNMDLAGYNEFISNFDVEVANEDANMAHIMCIYKGTSKEELKLYLEKNQSFLKVYSDKSILQYYGKIKPEIRVAYSIMNTQDKRIEGVLSISYTNYGKEQEKAIFTWN